MPIAAIDHAFNSPWPELLEIRAIDPELGSQFVHIVGFLINRQTFYPHRILDDYLRILAQRLSCAGKSYTGHKRVVLVGIEPHHRAGCPKRRTDCWASGNSQTVWLPKEMSLPRELLCRYRGETGQSAGRAKAPLIRPDELSAFAQEEKLQVR